MPMSIIIVETTYDTPLDDAEHARVGQRVDACLAAHGAAWVRSYLSTDRRRMVCEFEAPDAEAVRLSYRNAGVGFERAWTAFKYERAAGSA